jgi:hypothetical protein
MAPALAETIEFGQTAGISLIRDPSLHTAIPIGAIGEICGPLLGDLVPWSLGVEIPPRRELPSGPSPYAARRRRITPCTSAPRIAMAAAVPSGTYHNAESRCARS